MSPFPRWRSILRITLLVALGPVIAIVAYIPIQQRILRWRAEHLLADIRGLELGKSTWTDAQRIMHRWGAWGGYADTCSSKRCSYQILMSDMYQGFSIGSQRIEPWEFPPLTLNVYRLFGGRPSFVEARFEVIDGIVWGKDYYVGVDVPASNGPDEFPYELLASATSDWRTEDFRGYGEIAHPEYSVGRPGGCTRCEKVYSRFTPFADPEVVNSLLDFNLECLTRRNPCRDQGDIMPSVWKRVLTEGEDRMHQREVNAVPSHVCNLSPEFVGRDRTNVVTAEVTAVRPLEYQSDSQEEVRFQILEHLKRATLWYPKMTYGTALPKNGIYGQNGAGRTNLTPGQRLILAFPSSSAVDPIFPVDLDPCDVFPLTQDNLAAVQRGIAKDIFPDSATKWP